MKRLSREERELQRSVEAGDWRPVRGKAREIARYRGLAGAVLRKDRRINIRISSQDLEALQERAVEEGIPYQTLIVSVLHKYAAGWLADRR